MKIGTLCWILDASPYDECTNDIVTTLSAPYVDCDDVIVCDISMPALAVIVGKYRARVNVLKPISDPDETLDERNDCEVMA